MTRFAIICVAIKKRIFLKINFMPFYRIIFYPVFVFIVIDIYRLKFLYIDSSLRIPIEEFFEVWWVRSGHYQYVSIHFLNRFYRLYNNFRHFWVIRLNFVYYDRRNRVNTYKFIRTVKIKAR